MLKKISKIPFKGTPEQEAQLKAVIEECKDNKSLLMHVMQQAQAIYGYLPFEVQAMIADGADDFTELGPGKVLQGLISKINKEVAVSGLS